MSTTHPDGVARFQIDTALLGTGSRVVVNGDDVTDRVAAFSLHAGPGQVTRLVLQLLAQGSIEGEGVVEVAGGSHAADFLDTVDRDELRAAMLDGGMGEDPLDRMLAVLLAWADGDPTPPPARKRR